MGAVSVIPATGWVAAGSSVGYTVLEHILPVAHNAYWYFNGAAAIGAPQAVASISAVVGDSSAAVVAGVTAGSVPQLLGTLTQAGVFGVVLLDWIDGVIVGVFAACTTVTSALAACDAVVSALAACAAAPSTTWAESDG